MREACLLILLFACSTEASAPPATPEKPPPEKPALGEWGTKAKASFTTLSALDVKSPEAEKECVASRTLVSMGERRSEPGIAEISAEIEKLCLLSDAWAPLLRLVPAAEGTNKAGYCDHSKRLIKKLKDSKADVAALEEEYARSCEETVKFNATGDLAKVSKLDPSSDKAIAVCRDARVEALQKGLTNKAAGAAMEKGVDELCALPDLFSSLKFAADKKKPPVARDSECLAAKVWIDTYSRSKKLKGKPLAAAKKGFKKSCAKWARIDPLKDLGKLAKMDPKSKEARELCVRAGVFVSAHRKDEATLEATRLKSCGVVEGWFQALDAACLTADGKLDKLQPHLSAEDFTVMKTELGTRCKQVINP